MTGYILGVIITVLVITYSLRAAPLSSSLAYANPRRWPI